MKRVFITVVIFMLLGSIFQICAQSAEKSSGVTRLNMKKKSTTSPKTTTPRSSEGSAKISIPMKQKPAVELGSEVDGFTWVSPVFTSVKTSEDIYEIEASISSAENIRFVNLFNNGRFIKNIIPPVTTVRKIEVKEPMELSLGSNDLKLEVVTITGKKLESSVEVVYDISSAKYFALVIAVEEYNDPGINDLDHPVNDASKFSELINTEYNFERENITFLRNPTKAEIFDALLVLRNTITPEDNLLIYYAGHGYWDEEMTTGYWLPKDADPNNPVNWLPNTDLTNYLNVLKSKHTLLIADACFSGGIFKTRAAFNNVLSVEKLYKLTSRKAITSGSLKEVPDKSVFVEYLIRRLDENKKKYLASEQLYSSLKEAVINNSPNIPRYGTIQNVGDEGGDFIFIRRD